MTMNVNGRFFGIGSVLAALGASLWCAEHIRQLGGESPLHNLMEVK